MHYTLGYNVLTHAQCGQNAKEIYKHIYTLYTQKREGCRGREGELTQGAPVDGVAGVARGTPADGVVRHHVAQCLKAARARARVHAAPVDARAVHRAVGIGDALVAASRRLVGVAEGARPALAHGDGALHAALGVRAAGVGQARVGHRFR